MQHARRPRHTVRGILLKLTGRRSVPATKPMPPAHEGVMALAAAMPVDGGWWTSATAAGD